MIKILILGGGFGGIRTALDLEKKLRQLKNRKFEITLIDRNGYHLFTPDIYEDALFINQKLDELSEEFKNGSRTEPSSFLICGGGFTGVELAAELGCCSKVIREKCRLRGRCSTITLFEAGPKILAIVPEKERRLFKERLTNLGIIIMENSPIEEVGPDFIKLKSGHKIPGDLIIWTTGIKPNHLLADIKDLHLTSSGKIIVENTLQVRGYKNIFVAGIVLSL